MDLNGKCVLLGVSGGIAAYKMANVASALRKLCLLYTSPSPRD